MISNGLEVSAYEQTVDFVTVRLLKSGNLSIDCVELAVATSLHRNLSEN